MASIQVGNGVGESFLPIFCRILSQNATYSSSIIAELRDEFALYSAKSQQFA